MGGRVFPIAQNGNPIQKLPMEGMMNGIWKQITRVILNKITLALDHGGNGIVNDLFISQNIKALKKEKSGSLW